MLSRRWEVGKRAACFIRRLYFTSDDELDIQQSKWSPSPGTTEEISTDNTEEEESSFFQGGSSYHRSLPIFFVATITKPSCDSENVHSVHSRADPLNIENADVPWVDDWFRTHQGSARIHLLSSKTDLSIDEVQSKTSIKAKIRTKRIFDAGRISKLLSMAPGLQKFMPLLHPALFSATLHDFSHTVEIMTMLKSELPAIDLGIVVSGFPRVLIWDKKMLYDCMCFLVVHYNGRLGAAEALNEYPMRLKFARQLLPELFKDQEKLEKEQRLREKYIVGRLYQFNKHRRRKDPPRNGIVYFESKPRLRE